MAYKPIDARRDEFRKYLERTGVLDMFTKVLSKLMTETDKPEDAIEFIRANIGDSLNDKDTIVSLNQKLEDANQLIEELRTKLRQYEPMDGVETTETPASVPETPVATEPVEPVASSPATVAPATIVPEASEEPMQVETTPVAAAKEPEATPAVEVAPVAVATDTTPATTTNTVEEEKKPAEGETAAAAAPAKTETEKEAASSTETPVAAAAEAEKPAESEAPAAAVASPAPATTTTTTEAAAAKPEEEKMEN